MRVAMATVVVVPMAHVVVGRQNGGSQSGSTACGRGVSRGDNRSGGKNNGQHG
jgi:hypothetical protein